MLEKLKNVASKVMRWTAGTITLICLIGIAIAVSPSEKVRPMHPKETRRVVAQVFNSESTGTAVVLNSSMSGSDFLTNQHVCDGAKSRGSFIILDNKRYIVTKIKPSRYVDLCLMHVQEDLRLSTEVAPQAPEFGEDIITAGHPLSMPLVVQRGLIGETFNTSDRGERPEYVTIMSVIAQPGQSGSPVFDSKGQIVGIIEAINPGMKGGVMGFALAVPWKAVDIFTRKEAPRTPWTGVPRAP